MLLADIPFELILVLVAALIGVISRLVEFTKKIRARVNAQMREKEEAEGVKFFRTGQEETDRRATPKKIRQQPAEFDLDPAWTGVPMPVPIAEKIEPPQPAPKSAPSQGRLKLGGRENKPRVAGQLKGPKRRSRPAAKSSKATTSTLLRSLKDHREAPSRMARRRQRRLGVALRDHAAVQRAIVLREILGPPRAARYVPHLSRR